MYDPDGGRPQVAGSRMKWIGASAMSSHSQETENPRVTEDGRLSGVRAAFGVTLHARDFDTHLHLVQTALGIDCVCVAIADESASWTLAATTDRAGACADGQAIDSAVASEVVAGCVARPGRTVDVTQHPDDITVTVLAAPLTLAGGHTVGALVVRHGAGRSWSDVDRAVVDAAARLVSERLDAAITAHEERQRFDLLVGAAAHDLRAPMSSATSAARLLGRLTTPSSMSERLLDVVERADTTATELLADLVDRALVHSTGRPSSRPRAQISLAPLLRRAAGVVSSARSIDIAIRCDETVEVWTEPVALLRIVQNLADNAARHSGSETLRIDVAAGIRGIEIAVEDHGRGLPPELQTWLPNASTGIDASVPVGLGLGLRTCVTLATELGARLRVDAPPRARVVVSLPVRAGDADPTPAA